MSRSYSPFPPAPQFRLAAAAAALASVLAAVPTAGHAISLAGQDGTTGARYNPSPGGAGGAGPLGTGGQGGTGNVGVESVANQGHGSVPGGLGPESANGGSYSWMPGGGLSLTTAPEGGGGGAGGVGNGTEASGGGGGGGATAASYTLFVAPGSLVTQAVGGKGGNGADGTLVGGTYASTGGGGGGGGHGVYLLGSYELAVNADTAGGAGGNGGIGKYNGGAARGGQGGIGILSNGTNFITVASGVTVAGGKGGDGGYTDATRTTIASMGGAGGAGIVLNVAGVVYNQGRIEGGDAGADNQPLAFQAAGGVGIILRSGTVINEGTISGGVSYGGVRQNAIEMENSALELHAGSVILGNVVATGTSNLLTLGGAGDQTFDVSALGNQYQGFTDYEVNTSANVTLAGTTTQVTPWVLSDGLLTVASDAALGSDTGALSFNGGSLQYTGASETTARPIHVNSGMGSIDVVDANTVLTWNGEVSGYGTLAKLGDGTLAIKSDSSGFAGGFKVIDGSLSVLGKLGGLVEVRSGATLTGDGTVGSTSVFSGGTLAPGKGAAGTLTVDGDLTMDAGSTLRILSDSSTTKASKVDVTGAATIAGTVANIEANGNYSTQQAYTILHAAQGVTGSFDGVTSNLAFLQPSLSRSGNDVVLTLQRKDVAVDPGTGGGTDGGTGGGTAPTAPTTPTSPADPAGPSAGGGSAPATRPMTFADAANSRNQRSVANAIESLGQGSALYHQVENLAVGQPANVFNALSGESHASAVSTLQAGADMVRALPMEHFRSNLNANLLAGAPTAQAGTSDIPTNLSALPSSSAKPVWAQLFGTWQTFGGGDAARVTQATSGLFVGGDQAVGGGWRAGGALGLSNTHSRAGDVSSKADISNYSATLYGGRSFAAGAGRLNFIAGGSYTWHDIDTRRDIATSGFDQSLKANYGASTGQLFTELGYALPAGGALTLEPFAGLAWSDLRTRGFSESGGSAALNGAGERNTVTTTTVGLRSRSAFTLGKVEGNLRGTVGWRHSFGDVSTRSTLWFDGGDKFTVAGVPQARDSALVEVSADVALSRAVSLGLAYGGEFGGGNTQNSAMLNLAWKF